MPALLPELLRPVDDVGAHGAAAAWWLLGVALPLATWLLFVSTRQWLRRRAAHEEHDADVARRPLAVGDCVLVGVVEDDGGDGPAVRVSVEQRGETLISKNKTRHVWREVGRRTTSRAFHVRRANGERVRVEPDARVFLVDQLDVVARTPDLPDSDARRTRQATLSAGERVYIIGRLRRGFDPEARGAGAYRDDSEGWVLGPPGRGRMLISTEPLGRRFRARGRVHGGLAIATVVMALATHLAGFWAYDDLFCFGRQASMALEEVHTTREWHSGRYRGHWHYHHWLTAREEGLRYHAEICLRGKLALADAQAHALVTLPMVVTPRHAVAGELHLSWVDIVFAAALQAGFLLVALFVVRTTRPWYDRKRIVDNGSGYLRYETVSVR